MKSLNPALRASLGFLLIFAVLAVGGRVLAQGMFGKPTDITEDSIVLIHVEGPISGTSASGSPLMMEAAASSVAICDELYKAMDDEHCKAVLLRVNSPGGSAAASDEIYAAVVAVKEKKPVVVSMGDVAASGGYYVAAPASYIYANPSTLTGSIGVIFSMLNWQEAAEKLGVSTQTLHAGKFKDIGSPWRDMTPEESVLLEGMLTRVHDQFIKAVDSGRENLDEAQVRALATGMIYIGEDAKANGLVDELGGLHEAAQKARELAGVGEDVPVQEYGGGSFLEELFKLESNSSLATQVMQQLASDPLTTLSRGLYLNTVARDLVIR
jgi:protease-4